jgi:VIT1/CCC1 family predicted Fe2+/Mn2+ transporter
MAYDALGAHARDDIGITEALIARPLQAAVTSSISFVLGGIGPLLAAFLSPQAILIPLIAGISLASLAAFGSLARHTLVARPPSEGQHGL